MLRCTVTRRASFRRLPQDLCERHEKGVLHKHQRALHKYSLMKRQMMSAAVQNREPESVEQLESRIVEVGRAAWVSSGWWPGGGRPLAGPGRPPGWAVVGPLSSQKAAVTAPGDGAGSALCGMTAGQRPGALPAPCPLSQGWGLLRPQQENVIQTMELRNYFSLYCLHQETQLVHVYLPLTSHILGAFVNSQIQGHKEVGAPGPLVRASFPPEAFLQL